MKPITPHSLALITFRVVALLFLLEGIYDLPLYLVYRAVSGNHNLVPLIDIPKMGIWAFVLYFTAPWLAKAATWKLRD
jgi:hypothetical protein